MGKAQKLFDNEPNVQTQLKVINNYADAGDVPQVPMVAMAKLGVAINDWMAEYDLDATAIQCWTSLQENYGINACMLMSMMSEKLMPSACEVDITGVLSMYALQKASGTPSALVDWNNNYGDDPNKCVLFHCGNWAKSFLPDIQVGSADILGNVLGEDRTYGAVAGRTPAGPVTYARISTDDINGMIRTYVGEGQFTDDTLETFGAKAVVEISDLQHLMKYICLNGFEHHVAINMSRTADVLTEAFDVYMGWDVYHHGKMLG